MPLTLTQRKPSGIWQIRGTIRGAFIRESLGTRDRAQAEEIRAQREAELFKESVYGKRATVTFAHAAESYLTSETRRPGTLALVGRLARHFRTAPLAAIDQVALDHAYRALCRPDAAPATRLRNVLAPLRAILEHAARRKWCERPAFEPIKTNSRRLAFFTPAQATALVAAAAPHLRPLLVFLIATGARLSEALELDWQAVDLAGGRAAFRRTKTGRARQVVLRPVARATLAGIAPPGARQGRVFLTQHGTPYRDTDRTSGGQIKTAWQAACRRAGLVGFRPHDCRHSFATWIYATEGHDLLALMRDGGWSSLSQVQIYAHQLAPDHQAAAAAWLAGEPLVIARRAGQ